jgi:transposase-like protein
MAQSNRYFRFSKLSEAKFRHLVRCFALDLTATQTAQLTGISLRSVNAIFLRLRAKIAAECERQSPLEGVLEADESYFGPQRVRGRCGRGAGGKTIVFGLLKRDDRVYTAIVPNASKAALQAVIRGRASLNSVVHTDGWAGYHGLVDLGYDKHLRVEHRENIFAQQLNHINGIESFWSLAKRRLSRFCGVPKRTFYLHLKETEFRFNHRNKDLYKELLNFLRKDPL